MKMNHVSLKTTFAMLIALLIPANVMALSYNFEKDGLFYNILNDSEVEVTYEWTVFDNEFVGEVVIPETVTYNGTTYQVVAIGDKAFHRSPELTSVVIGNSVKRIGNEVFQMCSALTSIHIGRSVESIGSEWFFKNHSLTSITVDEDNPVFDSRGNCNAIIETATDKLRYGCMATVIPDGIKAIGNYAFYYYTQLTGINIPSSVVSIGDRAFRSCESFTRVELPESLEYIGDGVFCGCSKLQSAPLPNSLTHMGKETYHMCFALTEANIPELITEIPESTFATCTKLETLTIDGPITRIGTRAFVNCDKLKNIALPNTLKVIDDQAFYSNDGFTSLILPDSVTYIGDEAFFKTYQLTSMVIPASVTHIGQKVLTGCTALRSIIVEAANPYYDSRDNCNAIIETATNTLIQACNYTTIPNTVNIIAIESFAECGRFTSIDFPESVTTICDYAFHWCNQLVTVHIPASVTSVQPTSFYGTNNITTLTVAEGNPVYYPSNGTNVIVERETDRMILGCRTSVIPNNIRSFAPYSMYGLNWTELDLPATVTEIGDKAFGANSYCQRVTCRATTPPTIYESSFHYANNTSLYVPQSALPDYQNHTLWKKFKEILPIVNAPGDLNGDGQLNISDVIGLISLLADEDANVDDMPEADYNGDGTFNISDVIAFINAVSNE